MLLKNLGMKGKHKLENRWCDVPYVVVGKMPNLPVYRVKPQSGTSKLKTLHRHNLLPIGELVQMPVLDNTEDVQPRPATRENVHKRHKIAKTDHSVPMQGGTSTESSDLECDWPQKPYRSYLEWILQRRDEINTDRPEQTGVCIPLNGSLSERENLLEDHALDSVQEPETVSEPESVSSEDDDRQQSHSSNRKLTPKPARPKRSVKSVVRLTYDEPGKAKDQPLTIVHRGVTIKIEKS